MKIKKKDSSYEKNVNELLKKVAESAYSVVKVEANSACACFAYQPAMPKDVKELSKKNSKFEE